MIQLETKITYVKVSTMEVGDVIYVTCPKSGRQVRAIIREITDTKSGKSRKLQLETQINGAEVTTTLRKHTERKAPYNQGF